MNTLSAVAIGGARRRAGGRRRALIAAITVLTLVTGLLSGTAAHAEDPPVPADRSLALSAWRLGGLKVHLAAEAALIGTDDQVREFLTTGLSEAQRADDRDAVDNVIASSGPSVRAAARQALAAADAGNADAIATFLNTGWQGPANIDTRVSVNQLLAVGGPQVREAAQVVLDAGDPEAMRTFLDSGWQRQWQTDQRLRVNQALAMGGPQVRSAAQRTLDAGTPEAMEGFLAYGWAVASARDDEVATLTELLAQAQAAGELAAQETSRAKEDGARAKEAAEAAKKAAELAAAATEAAREHTAEAAAHALRAAAAADKAAEAARVAVDAAAAASRAARAAASAAARAASAAAKAGEAASKAYQAAADAATDAGKASAARQAAQNASAVAQQARDFAATASAAGQAIQAGLDSIAAAKGAAEAAKRAADANDDAIRYAQQAGADASAAVAAAQRARANADRAIRAANAAEQFLNVAMAEAYAARDAALRAANDADAAAAAAIDAANHAGEAAQAANRATAYANAATVAAQRAVDAADEAQSIYLAARDADAARLAVFRDEGLESAQAASVQYELQRQRADWDVEEATKRSAETNQLVTLVQNPATPAAAAVAAARKVTLTLAGSQGAWTQQAALDALTGDDMQVVAFVRTGLARANALDDRYAVMNLAITDNTAFKNAAMTALNGNDTTVKTFLRTQNYPGRYTQDRLKVNQILAAANAAGDVVLAQAAQAALDAGTLPALRDFLETGQYTAAAIGQRVRVNQVAAAGGPEVKAAAQIVLDGPPAGLREFLDTGQYYAAERDYEGAAHLATVGGLLQRISETAETAVKNALDAQTVAAEARHDAAQAADYAQQALDSAERAAAYAAQAQTYVAAAAQSVEKATAAVATARSAATRATSSARSAVKSAAWAIASQNIAMQAAKDAYGSAQRAYDSAVAAGQDAQAAVDAANAAFTAYQQAQGLEIAKCQAEYANGPAPELERMLTGSSGNFYRNCVANVIADPKELATRAYTNATLCGIYPDQASQAYQNCIHSTLDPEFRGIQPLIFAQQILTGLTLLYAVPVGLVSGTLCIATLVCGAVAGTLLTIADIGVNIFKLVNGDQSLFQTLTNLGQLALESLLLAGVGKALSAGFRSLKALYIAARDARIAQNELRALSVVRVVINGGASCLRPPGGAPLAVAPAKLPALRAGGVRAQTAGTPPANSDACRLVLGRHAPGEALALQIRGYTYNDPNLAEVTGNVNGLPYALWMHEVNQALRDNHHVAVAMDGFRLMDAGTVEDAQRAYVEAYRTGYLASTLQHDWVATPWEMYRIGFYVRLGHLEWRNIDWYFGTTKIALPEPTWYKDADGVWWPRYED
ncbi:ALF repeat-containing protein [Catellatospora sichuanensis]|uniref:ALF repeat-containing protein n=1 Tax=Catellatospora sichuanensis TaxID=1969805 RepID=UPI001182E9B9|nr:ALF repeat-containing protein [Catellatospora sichuanensis]